MVLSDTDGDLMGMEVCLCMGVCVSLGDGGSVGNQGKRAAVSRRGRRGCRSPSFSWAW